MDEKMKMEDSKLKILVVFLHGLGDNIMVTPAIRALRKKFPDAYIALMGLKTLPVRDIWKNNPYIDEFIESSFTYNPRFWNPIVYFLVDYWKIKREVKKLKKERGFNKVYIVQLLSDRRFKTHKIIRMAKELDVKLDSYKTDFFLSKKDENEAFKIMRKFKLKKGKFICLHRTSSDLRKNWDIDEAQKVCDTLKKYKILVFNSKKSFLMEERHDKKHLRGKNVINYISKNLRISAALLKKSKLLIGVDSIMVHLAGALGILTIALYKNSNPKKYIPIERKRFKIIHSKKIKAKNVLNAINEVLKQK